ncbi:MAG TPA: hypothetical protein VFT72_17785 [Opitutaceae bacterium]|nr:hypothetical protein [Opitutaceae bacterium]
MFPISRSKFRAVLPLAVVVGLALAQSMAVRERPIFNVSKCVTLHGDSAAEMAGVLLGAGPAIRAVSSKP